jgi:hypothetical protein
MNHIKAIEQIRWHRHPRKTPDRRFFNVSKITAFPEKSNRSGVKAKASLTRHPVKAKIVQKVRTPRFAF